MSQENDLYRHIKESFEQKRTAAPNNLWNDISDNLNVEDHNALDDKVKTSFGEQKNSTTPEHIWTNVNRQLNIDLVWERISKQLAREPVFYWLQRVGVAAVLLISLLTGCYLLNSSTSDSVHSKTWKADQKESNQNSAIVANRLESDMLKTSSIETRGQSEFDSSAPNESGSGIDEISSEEVIKKYTNNSVSDVSDISNSFTHGSYHSNFEGGTVMWDSLPGTTESHPITEVFQLSGSTSRISSVQEKTGGFPKIGNTMAADYELDSVLVDSLKVQMEQGTELASISDEDSIHKQMSPRKGRFHVGISYFYHNTQLNNYEWKLSRESTSLVRSTPSFKGNLAITTGYHWGDHGVEASLHLNSIMKQQTGFYSRGKYIEKEVELMYDLLSLQYNRNLKNLANFGIGFYAARLRDYEWTYNDIVVKPDDNYSTFDYGLNMSLSKEITITESLALDCGINFTRGLKNVFTGNDQANANFDRTYNQRMGVFTTLKYKLSANSK